MAPMFLVLALFIQCTLIHADSDVSPEDIVESKEIPQPSNIEDEAIKGFSPAQNDWLEIWTSSSNDNMFSGPSASMMSQITNSNKTLEEQLVDIKEIAQQISLAIKVETDKFIAYAMANNENEIDENGMRKRRSVETPVDSTQMVMRLLKHIKSNNEYQNIAIEKMMSAQEIAEKFGIEFNPDPEILSDLAIAANEHAQEMTNMLKDACDLKNVTMERVEFIPAVEESKKKNDTYYIYSVHPEEKHIEKCNYPAFEYVPDIVSKLPSDHIHEPFPYFNYPYESQINSPPVHHHSSPVTPKPSFYDPFSYPFTPATDYYSPYCTVEPIMPALLIPLEEIEAEPELVGEEVEETITTRMFVERGDEPGSTTVNHVTSYTISEKSHFKPPHIESLPQQLQYCFFLI